MGTKSNGISTVLDNTCFTRKLSRMGILTNIKVLQLGVWLLLLFVSQSSSSLCPHHRQYWHEEKEKCINCTTCQAGEIVIRPCQIHADALCSPISKDKIYWSFLNRREHKHHHKKKLWKEDFNHFKLHLEEAGSPEANTLFLDSSGKDFHLPEPAALHHLENSKTAQTAEALTRPFSSFERVVWDWQVVVLLLAVIACVLFFFVTLIYSIHHLRYWRRLKKPDAEEVCARRSLMVPGNTESHGSPPSLESYAQQQSLCMEQLLVLKTKDDLGTAKGNFYIVRDKACEIQEDSQ